MIQWPVLPKVMNRRIGSILWCNLASPTLPLLQICWQPKYSLPAISLELDGAVQGVEKIKLIITMLEAGLHPMFSDLDVVWLRDPLPFVRLLDKTNMLVSSDSCDVSPDVRLDHCPSIVGNSREVKGSGTFVGKMNVSLTIPATHQGGGG
jgi:hypothetical protein